jgi:hypothetical protein
LAKIDIREGVSSVEVEIQIKIQCVHHKGQDATSDTA